MDYFAHSLEGKPIEEWHRLEEHLFGTAKLAARGLSQDLRALCAVESGLSPKPKENSSALPAFVVKKDFKESV